MKEEVFVVDEARTFEPVEAENGVIRLPGNSSAFIRYR